MLLKILSLLPLVLLCLLPILFDGKLKVEGSVSDDMESNINGLDGKGPKPMRESTGCLLKALRS